MKKTLHTLKEEHPRRVKYKLKILIILLQRNYLIRSTLYSTLTLMHLLCVRMGQNYLLRARSTKIRFISIKFLNITLSIFRVSHIALNNLLSLINNLVVENKSIREHKALI